MINRIAFLLMLLISVAALAAGCRTGNGTTEIKMYVVDSELLQLIPVEVKLGDGDAEHKARAALRRLIEGFDDNTKIRRLIPKINGCMSVSVRDGCAWVDIKDKLIENHPRSRELEKLTVYSIVNTLTDIDGIDCVRFTVNKRTDKSFMGFMDMSRVFVRQKLL